MTYAKLEIENKYLRYALIILSALFIISLLVLQYEPYRVCDNSGGVLYDGDECINLTNIPMCKAKDNILYEMPRFTYNGS